MSVVEDTERRIAKSVTPRRNVPAGESGAIIEAKPVIETPIETAVALPAQTAAPAKRFPFRRLIGFTIFLSLLAVGGVYGTNYWLDARQFESTDDAFIDGRIIPITPQVQARVISVPVVDNQFVKKGDVLIQLDPTDYQVIVDQKKAVEASAVGRVQEARTQLAVNEANVGQAKAELDVASTNAQNMDQDYQRFTGLDPRARSQQQLDNASAAQRSAAATVAEAKAKITSEEARVADAEAAVKTAESDAAKAAADTHQAEIQLSYCTITAPEDGVVTRKNIEQGMFLMMGQPLLSIVPTDVWVTANFKETQLDLMHPGQEAFITVDAYPGRVLHGHLDSIQRGTGSRFALLPSENATGNFVKVVQRVPVKIVFDPGALEDKYHPLALGMSVLPNIKVREREPLRTALGF